MKSILLACCAAVLLAAPAAALEPVREGQDTSIARAVYNDGKLWFLTDAGKVFTIGEADKKRTAITLPDPANDLWLSGGKPMAITCPRDRCFIWTLQRFDGGAWQNAGQIEAKRDEVLYSVSESEGRTILLTSKRIIEFSAGSQSSERLSIPGPQGLMRVAAVLATPDRILIGINAGEWGGGMRAIDRKTGKLTVIESNVSGGLCGGPLNTGCDPVNGIVEEPWKPGCVVAAVGLVHMGPNGRLVEVCGTEVKRLYFRNLQDCDEKAPQTENRPCLKRDGELPFETEAFFGLVRQGDTIWAVGIDGLYRITQTGVEHIKELPKYDNIDGTLVSFALSGLVLVLTEINRRVSVSGAVPLLVAR